MRQDLDRLAREHAGVHARLELATEPPPREVTDEWVAPYLSDRWVRRDTAKLLRGVDPRDTLDAAAKLGCFEGEALVAWGTDDPFFTLEHGRRLAACFREARFVEIPGARAFVPEDAPERLAELLLELVGSPVGRPAPAPASAG